MTEEMKEATLEAVKSTYTEDLLELLSAQEESLLGELGGILEDPRVLPVLMAQHKDKLLGPLQEDGELMELLEEALPAKSDQVLPGYICGSEEAVKHIQSLLHHIQSLLHQLSYIRLTIKAVEQRLPKQEA